MDTSDRRFADRTEAGRQLAAAVAAAAPSRPMVFALPRGGVPVAAEVAQRLAAPLDLVLVRKIGAPGAPELALGALVEGDPPDLVMNDDVRRLTGATEAYLDRALAAETAELARRRRLYLGARAHLDPRGHTAVVVDDGLATGATMKAAIRALRRRGAGPILVAVPVAPAETLDEMRAIADTVICLRTPREFYGVGAHYDEFHQLSDDETAGLLRRCWDPPPTPGAPGR